MRALCLLATLASAGCLRETTFRCAEAAQCGDGACEASGFCSFVDTTCADSGRRYGEFSGAYSNQCVGSEPPGSDGGVDGSSGDASAGRCPGTYTTLGTIATHRYRVIGNAAAFLTQSAACAADASTAYLAIPDDAAELSALLAASAMSPIWVGVHDPQKDGTFETVRGAAFSSTSPLWDQGEPDDKPLSGGGTAECVIATSGPAALADDRCNASRPAVCECEP